MEEEVIALQCFGGDPVLNHYVFAQIELASIIPKEKVYTIIMK